MVSFNNVGQNQSCILNAMHELRVPHERWKCELIQNAYFKSENAEKTTGAAEEP